MSIALYKYEGLTDIRREMMNKVFFVFTVELRNRHWRDMKYHVVHEIAKTKAGQL